MTDLIALTVVLKAARPLAVTAFVMSRLHITQFSFPNFWLESFWISIKTCLRQKMQNSIKIYYLKQCLVPGIWLAITGSSCNFRSGHDEQQASTPVLLHSLEYLKVE